MQAVSTKSNGYLFVRYDVGDDVIAHITSKPMKMDKAFFLNKLLFSFSHKNPSPTPIVKQLTSVNSFSMRSHI